MNPVAHIKVHWRTGLAAAALSMMAGFLCLTQPFGEGVVGLSYDWLFLFRHHIPVKDVVIFYMDPDSDGSLGQQRFGSWDRAVHARFIGRLREFQPRAIAFDVTFTSPSDTNADQQLALAAKAAGNVVVATKSEPEVHEGEIVGWKVPPPYPALRGAVRWGVVEISDHDKVFRSHHYREDLGVPSMAWRVAELTEAHPPAAYVPRMINYYGPPRMLPHFSYYKIFEAETNAILAAELAAAISNKVVFVGALYDIGYTGGKRSDDYRTPYTGWTGARSAGVEIQATAYLNLVRGDWLRRLSPWAEVAIILLCGIVFGMGLVMIRPGPAVVWSAVGFLLIGTVAALLAWQRLIWFPWLVVGAIQIPCAFAWSLLVHTRRLQREKHALGQALAMASRGQGSPTVPAGSPMPAGDGVLTPWGSPTPFLTPSPGGEVPFPALRDRARLVVPTHELLRCIGRGAYGEVFLARDVLGSYHAVKVVYRSSTSDPVALDREFNGLKSFTPISRSHPGLVHILQVGRNEDAGYLYYVMELGDDVHNGQKIDPDTYSARTLARDLKNQKRLPLAERLGVCILLAEALDYLHRQKLIHRDIKPSNIIFVAGQPKFADIGLVTEVMTETRDISNVGTPLRIAPEGPGRPTADIYGLGKMLYETGFAMEVNRFPELPTEVIGQGVSGVEWFELNRIVMRACDPNPERRYQTAADLRIDLVALRDRCAAQPMK